MATPPAQTLFYIDDICRMFHYIDLQENEEDSDSPPPLETYSCTYPPADPNSVQTEYPAILPKWTSELNPLNTYQTPESTQHAPILQQSDLFDVRVTTKLLHRGFCFEALYQNHVLRAMQSTLQPLPRLHFYYMLTTVTSVQGLVPSGNPEPWRSYFPDVAHCAVPWIQEEVEVNTTMPDPATIAQDLNPHHTVQVERPRTRRRRERRRRQRLARTVSRTVQSVLRRMRY